MMSTTAETVQAIRQCVEKVTGQPQVDDALPPLDSLGVVELISELELTFDCLLDVTDADQLKTVTGISQLLQSR